MEPDHSLLFFLLSPSSFLSLPFPFILLSKQLNMSSAYQANAHLFQCSLKGLRGVADYFGYDFHQIFSSTLLLNLNCF